jgi:uncharacterized membrane protein YeaQ/YmgE (transglycosylase-associated protein family)
MKSQKPALLAGLLIGVLSALPVVNVGNCCCCLWVVLGGLLATYLAQQAQPGPIETSSAIVTGILAGIIGAIVAVIIELALSPLIGPYQMEMMRRMMDYAGSNIPPEARTQIEDAINQSQGAGMGAASKLFGLVISVPIYIVFSMLGSLLGVAFFKKKLPPVGA